MATDTPPVGAPIESYTPDHVYGPKPTNEEVREESYARLGLYTGDPTELPGYEAPVVDETPPTPEVPAVVDTPPAFTTTTTGAVS